MTKINGFDCVQVSEDGAHIAGYKQGVTASDEQIIVTAATPADNTVDETLAIIAEGCALDHEQTANHYYTKAKSYEKRIRELLSKRIKLRRKIRRWKKATPVAVIFSLVLGFGLGILLGVNQVLEMHGPTVTLIGTIGAYGIYTAVGFLFSAIFGWLGRESVKSSISLFTEDLAALETDIEKAIAKRDHFLSEFDKFTKLARQEKKKSWHYRGII